MLHLRILKINAIVLCVSLGFTACGDPTRFTANFSTVADTITVFALTGTPLSVPTALNTFHHEAVRAEATSGYDVVFDIDASGRVVLYPPSAVGGFGSAGLRTVTDAFDDLETAPNRGFDSIDPLTVSAGEVVVIRAEPPECANSIRPEIYTKLVVDSIDLVNRTITFRVRVNPNCGFRDLTEGVPDN
ncbi:MAG: hypothetical protein H7Z74_00825 [Anaerolineae bacterium]|nr:hypothetical protein [Gemmatimonadaceae bacterium]